MAIFDNGVAHEDSLPACYDNALSLICEKKPACRIPNQNGNGGAGYSRNGVGAGTALKHLASPHDDTRRWMPRYSSDSLGHTRTPPGALN